MAFPVHRLRRLRRTEGIRRMVRETMLSVDDLVMPLFVSAGADTRQEMKDMTGSFLLSGSPLVEEAKLIHDLGVPAVLLFGVPQKETKDAVATGSYADDGPVPRAIRLLKEARPSLLVIADVCLCEYTDHGHCGLTADEEIHNDRTLEILERAAVTYARAGADVIAPSGMMDGMTQAIRTALDGNGFEQTLVMPYSAKFASQLYGPFKRVTSSAPEQSRHATHQMDTANRAQALMEVSMDIEEGADIVIVKPAGSSLDIIRDIKNKFDIPIAAYQVSGETEMVRAAGDRGLIDVERVMMESLTCIKRAGATIIITYFAKDVARMLQ